MFTRPGSRFSVKPKWRTPRNIHGISRKKWENGQDGRDGIQHGCDGKSHPLNMNTPLKPWCSLGSVRFRDFYGGFHISRKGFGWFLGLIVTENGSHRCLSYIHLLPSGKHTKSYWSHGPVEIVDEYPLIAWWIFPVRFFYENPRSGKAVMVIFLMSRHHRWVRRIFNHPRAPRESRYEASESLKFTLSAGASQLEISS